MISRLVFLLFCGNIALNLGNVQKLPRVKRQSLRVQINVTDDTVCMRYIRPSPSTKLEGFILGYGSSFFSNQYISLPSDGKSYITEVDAEPRYLIAVRPAPVPNYKKPCSGKTNKLKPLQLVIGTLTPTSAFLSWGVLVNPKHDWTTMNNCANGRFYTVRYREKDKNKKWVLQLCPTTETVVDNLKPNTVYEFGVKDNTDNGIWSKSFSHKMTVPGKSKENGQLQNNIKLSKIPTFIPVDSKARIPITIIKQVLQNITHRGQSKSPEKFPVSGPIQVHIIIPDLSGTQQKLPSPVTLDISETPKKTLAQNESQEWPSESKTAEVQEISPQSYPAMTVLDWERSQPTAPSVSEESESSPVHTESDLESSKPSITPMVELPLSTLAPRRFPEFPKTKTTPPLQIPTEILASSEMQPVPSVPQTPAPKTTQTKPVYSKTQPALSRATASDEIDVSDSKPAVTNEPLEALTPKTSKALDQPRETLAPSETPFIPFKWEPSATPEGRHLKPAPEAKHHVPSHKTTISPHVLHPKPEKKDPEPFRHETQLSPDEPQTKPDIEAVTIGKEKSKTTIAPKVSHQIPARTKTSPSPGIISTKPSTKSGRRVSSKPSPKVPQTKPAAVLQTTSQPFILKPTMSSETPKLTMAPKGTQLKPKTPGKSDVSQTKAVSPKPHSSATTESPRLKTVPHKIYLTTAKPKMSEKPHGRLVINKTTPAPGRTKTPGGFTWGKVSRGDKLTDRDATRVLSTSSSISYNTPVDSAVARKKPEPVATPPDSPRQPLVPAKPTPMKRKPLPPNTVTGKPGRSGNILMPHASSFSTASSTAKPTGPASLTKTSSPKKPPTAASSPDYSNPMFSSLPTTETDIAGTPRYRGDHVKYIKKEETVPCSITDTLQHFPTEEGDSTERATAPPQKPPTNLTVVTVEGCPSFVILDWKKPLNETVTEYKVVSTENGGPVGKDKSIITTNQTHSTVENLKPNTSYEFVVIPSNPLGEGPSSESKPFKTESADPRVTEPIPMGKDAIWTEIKFNSDTYSECKGKQYVKRTWYKKFVGVQVCNSLRYKIYLSDSLTGTFYNIGDQRGHGEDHCQFVDSYLDGRTGQQLPSDQLPTIDGYYRAVRQEPVHFGKIGAETHTNYVQWYECGTTIPGKW